MTPADALHHIDTSKLYLPFLRRLRTLLLELQAMKVTFVATPAETAGYRSFAEQQKLWCQGRTMPGKIVTNAQAGQSAHNFGLAVDLTRFIGISPSWAEADYACLGPAAAKVGLVWGGNWPGFPDRPHIQWPHFVTATDMLPLKRLYLANPANPLPPVWTYVTHETPTQPHIQWPTTPVT